MSFGELLCGGSHGMRGSAGGGLLKRLFCDDDSFPAGDTVLFPFAPTGEAVLAEEGEATLEPGGRGLRRTGGVTLSFWP